MFVFDHVVSLQNVLELTILFFSRDSSHWFLLWPPFVPFPCIWSGIRGLISCFLELRACCLNFQVKVVYLCDDWLRIVFCEVVNISWSLYCVNLLRLFGLRHICLCIGCKGLLWFLFLGLVVWARVWNLATRRCLEHRRYSVWHVLHCSLPVFEFSLRLNDWCYFIRVVLTWLSMLVGTAFQVT